MLYAVLVCSDTACDIAYEAWGEADDLERVRCEECGSLLEVVGFANADREGIAPGSPEVKQRRAA